MLSLGVIDNFLLVNLSVDKILDEDSDESVQEKPEETAEKDAEPKEPEDDFTGASDDPNYKDNGR